MKKIFISYSHRDEEWKERLVTQLNVLGKAGYFDVWDDRRIEAGADWSPEIEKAMEAADVSVLLISEYSLTSDFILRKEVPRLLEKRLKEGLRLIPLIVRPCPWQKIEWVSGIQVRPRDGKPLTGMDDHQVGESLSSLAEEILSLMEASPSKATAPSSPSNSSTSSRDTTVKGSEDGVTRINLTNCRVGNVINGDNATISGDFHFGDKS